MDLRLDVLQRSDMNKIVKERNKILDTLRTSFRLNDFQQQNYFENVLSDRKGNTRYFKLVSKAGTVSDNFVGLGGIENIQWENRIGEMSIMVFEDFQGNGFGSAGVKLFLEQAFNYSNLENVWGECYYCGNVGFWEKLVKKYGAYYTKLPNRKYYEGKYYDSYYFNFNKDKMKW